MVQEGKTVSVTINFDAFEDSKLYRLKKATILRVVPGETLLGKHIAIQTNYPTNETEFVRSKFESLAWFSRYGDKLPTSGDHHAEVKDLEMYCEVKMLRSGTFKFKILEEDRK